MQVLQLHEVADRVVEAAPIAHPAGGPADGAELLARRLPHPGTDVVEAHDHVDDLVGGEVVDLLEPLEGAVQVPLGDPRQRHDAEQRTGTRVAARDLGRDAGRLGLVEDPDHAVEGQQGLAAVVGGFSEPLVGAEGGDEDCPLLFVQGPLSPPQAKAVRDLAKELADK